MDTDQAEPLREQSFTRRQYLIYQAVVDGADTDQATETVDTWSTEHPDNDMGETMTWAAWQGLGQPDADAATPARG